ncbi:uncharacterized protein LOC134542292 [Bacillus rossius redtenbacheri]|uniref:uncharacterized protein LOC134542292 n=1 Tax=Bacillus rossius redtenbacheri TaxID=93214 RepID=UPI002FDCA063
MPNWAPVQKILRHIHHEKSIPVIAVQKLREHSTYNVHKRSDNHEKSRLVVFVGLVLNILVGNSYQGSLTSVLTTPHYYPDMNTIDELMQSELGITAMATFNGMDLDLSDTDDEYMFELLRRVVFVRDLQEAMRMVAVHRNACRFTESNVAILEARQPEWISDGQPLTHIIKDCAFRLPVSYFASSASSPFLARFSTLVQRLVSGGLYIKWFDDFTQESQKAFLRELSKAKQR